jgi:hypothetical protein
MSNTLLEFIKNFRVTGAGWYWIIWFFGGFGIYEGWGLLFNAQDTLSWQFWGLEQIDFADPMNFALWTPAHWAIAAVITVFVIWLGAHLVFGIWR